MNIALEKGWKRADTNVNGRKITACYGSVKKVLFHLHSTFRCKTELSHSLSFSLSLSRSFSLALTLQSSTCEFTFCAFNSFLPDRSSLSFLFLSIRANHRIYHVCADLSLSLQQKSCTQLTTSFRLKGAEEYSGALQNKTILLFMFPHSGKFICFHFVVSCFSFSPFSRYPFTLPYLNH